MKKVILNVHDGTDYVPVHPQTHASIVETDSERQFITAEEKAKITTIEETLTTHLEENASTTTKGHVQLSDATNSTSKTLGATANAVKKTYDLADGKYTKPSTGIPKTDLADTIQTDINKIPTLETNLTNHLSEYTGFDLKQDTNGKVSIDFSKRFFNIGDDGKPRYAPNGDGNCGASLGDKLYIWKVI